MVSHRISCVCEVALDPPDRLLMASLAAEPATGGVGVGSHHAGALADRPWTHCTPTDVEDADAASSYLVRFGHLSSAPLDIDEAIVRFHH